MKRPEPSDEWPQSWKDSAFYDRAEVFGDVWRLSYAYAYELRREATLEMIREVLPSGSRILDIAAAQGNFTLALAEIGYEMTWNDLRNELEGYVRLKWEHGNVSYRPGNAFDLAFDSLFDGVLIGEVIEHVAHPDQFLAQVAKLVRPGGYIFMTTPNGAYFFNRLPRFSDCRDPSLYEAIQFRPNSDGHIFLLWPDELPCLADPSGLIIDRLWCFTNALSGGACKTEGLLNWIPKSWVMCLERASGLFPPAVTRRCMLHLGARFVRQRGEMEIPRSPKME